MPIMQKGLCAATEWSTFSKLINWISLYKHSFTSNQRMLGKRRRKTKGFFFQLIQPNQILVGGSGTNRDSVIGLFCISSPRTFYSHARPIKAKIVLILNWLRLKHKGEGKTKNTHLKPPTGFRYNRLFQTKLDYRQNTPSWNPLVVPSQESCSNQGDAGC